MSKFYSREVDRLEQYTFKHGLTVTKHLGHGADGIVYLTDRSTAIKALKYDELFEKELATYRRLKSRGVVKVGRFNIPQLVNHDSDLLVIEITFVVPPFVVDFAGVYLDEPSPFIDDLERMNEWQQRKLEQFGDDWTEVQLLMWSFQKDYGIYLNDVKPGNVTVRQAED